MSGMTSRIDDEPTAGFIYLLSNPAMPGMIKIGFSTDQAAMRAVELSRPTGIPIDFELVYDELVSDCRAVERHLHKRFAAYRVNRRREFFRVPVREAIAALQEEAKAYPVTPRAEERLDILPQLERRFRRWLHTDLIGAYIIQVSGLVYLESAFQPSVAVRDQDIHRQDLGFISDGMDSAEPYFPSSNSIEENARRFVGLDTYTIHYLTDLFNSEANEFIDQLHKYQEEIPFAP
jgi:T5orf172 domain